MADAAKKSTVINCDMVEASENSSEGMIKIMCKELPRSLGNSRSLVGTYMGGLVSSRLLLGHRISQNGGPGPSS